MKIELTELELLHVLAMLDVVSTEDDRMHAKLVRRLETGVIEKLERLPETGELMAKLNELDTLVVYEKFLDVAEELNLIAVE